MLNPKTISSLVGLSLSLLSSNSAYAGGSGIYALIDDAAGYSVVGREDDAIKNAVVISEFFHRAPRGRFGDTDVYFIRSSDGTEFLSGKPRNLIKNHNADVFAKIVAPKQECGDFTELFTTLEYRLLRDDLDQAIIILSSPLVDIDASYCSDEAQTPPKIPQNPKPEYLLDKILTHKAVKGFIVVGAHPKQEQAWFRYILKIKGAVRPKFVKRDNIRKAILEIK